jgi:hypothetical protein
VILGSIQNRRPRVAWLLVGCVSVVLLAWAGPALAKHHARKPYKLWHQYPLRVQRRGERIRPKHASPSPQPAVVATPHRIARRQPRSSSTKLGLWLALAGGVGLVVVGLVALKRQRPSTGGDSLLPRPGPEVASNGDSLFPPAEPGLAPDGDSLHPSGEPGLAPDGDSLHPSGEPGLSPVENSRQPVSAAAPAQTGPETEPAHERVRLQLADGRSLEGYKRNSPSTSPHLIILDILAAFDPNGNAAPTRPSDSFILESEISSIQRIDDS